MGRARNPIKNTNNVLIEAEKLESELKNSLEISGAQ
jgi:hypothetical protein